MLALLPGTHRQWAVIDLRAGWKARPEAGDEGFSAGCKMRAGPPSGNVDEEEALATKQVSPERQLSQMDISYATDVAEQPGSSYQPGQPIPPSVVAPTGLTWTLAVPPTLKLSQRRIFP